MKIKKANKSQDDTKFIKKIKFFGKKSYRSSQCITLNKFIETPEDYKKFVKELDDAYQI